jgi:hypothetical protein
MPKRSAPAAAVVLREDRPGDLLSNSRTLGAATTQDDQPAAKELASLIAREVRAPEFIASFAGEWGCSALLDEVARPGSISYARLALADPKSDELRKSVLVEEHRTSGEICNEPWSAVRSGGGVRARQDMAAIISAGRAQDFGA